MGLMDKFHEGLGAATTASERMLQIAKLKSQISSLGQQQGELHRQMGLTAALLVRRHEVDHPQLVDLGAQIDGLEAQVVSAQAEIDALQAVPGGPSVPCPACGAAIRGGVRFCPSCGSGMPEPDAEAAPGSVPCPRCNTPLEADAKFCGRCGASMTGSE